MASAPLFVDPDNPNPDTPDPERRRAALDYRPPEGLGSHTDGAKYYDPDRELVDAINVALAAGAPLLLTGAPGTGKTQVAYYLARYLGIPGGEVHVLNVRSSSASTDLMYTYNAIGYLRAANAAMRTGETTPLSPADFITKGPLWLAYQRDLAVLLIDEIDKAPRDFPNDLLDTLDQNRFFVAETQEWHEPKGKPPIVVITSNDERRLPKPFLRRCVFHHIELTEALVARAVAKHAASDFPELALDVRAAALEQFWKLQHEDGLNKYPATAELLLWLAVLAARAATHPITAAELRASPLGELPALGVLIKDRHDLDRLRGTRR